MSGIEEQSVDVPICSRCEKTEWWRIFAFIGDVDRHILGSLVCEAYYYDENTQLVLYTDEDIYVNSIQNFSDSIAYFECNYCLNIETMNNAFMAALDYNWNGKRVMRGF